MTDATFWWEQAEKFRERAQASADPNLREELLELAAVCDEVAAKIEERGASG
jgi:hypothetical protein